MWAPEAKLLGVAGEPISGSQGLMPGMSFLGTLDGHKQMKQGTGGCADMAHGATDSQAA